jgi:hypothetical protein
MILARPLPSTKDFDHAETAVKAIQVVILLWGEHAERSAVERQLVDFLTYYTTEFTKVWENVELAPPGTVVNPGAVRFWAAFARLARVAPRVIEQFADMKKRIEAGLARLANENETAARVTMKNVKRQDAVKADIAALKTLTRLGETRASTRDDL